MLGSGPLGAGVPSREGSSRCWPEQGRSQHLWAVERCLRQAWPFWLPRCPSALHTGPKGGQNGLGLGEALGKTLAA